MNSNTRKELQAAFDEIKALEKNKELTSEERRAKVEKLEESFFIRMRKIGANYKNIDGMTKDDQKRLLNFKVKPRNELTGPPIIRPEIKQVENNESVTLFV